MSPPMPQFPFLTSLSLEGVIRYWQQLAQDADPNMAAMAQTVLARVEAAPELRGRINDPGVLERHAGLVETLMTALFPVGDAEAVGATGQPFGWSNIFETPAAAEIGLFEKEVFVEGAQFAEELMQRGKLLSAYLEILHQVYGQDLTLDFPVLLSLTDAETGLRRHFQVVWDPAFLQVLPRGPLPEPTEEELVAIAGEPTDLERWMELLPPDSFEFSGLGIVRASEVTFREAVSRLKDDLLEQGAMSTPERLDQLQVRIRTMLGAPDVRIGLIGFMKSTAPEALDSAFPVGRSMLLSTGEAPPCPHKSESNYADVLRSGRPIVISDLETIGEKTGFEYHLLGMGLRSLLIQPLHLGEKVVGMLEVASPNPGDLTAFSSFKLQNVAQPFATALERLMAEREDRIQSVIKTHYTSIHPSVEWRFRDAAHAILSGKRDGEDAEEIVFHDLHPLYGLTDIRGSSDVRRGAIQDDLVEQLRLAHSVVRLGAQRPSLPVLDQIAYRLEQALDRIESDLHTEDETAAFRFLREEVEPLFDELARWDADLEARVHRYREALDPDLGLLYRRRRSFDDSVARFNQTISQVIDEEQGDAQTVFPHFFEKFQTDGVDYNIYVGSSLVPSRAFSRMYLQNLRLWQLKLVSRIEWELDRVRQELPTDLAPTHLVLAQDQPLSIRFRKDEKRFDVDGAYNIRYELVKKRIDKVKIRGSGERLTQPGHLAVVYSQPHEAAEYRRYLEYLESAAFYHGAIEEHDLEDMQGVVGLRALRVAIEKDPARQPPLPRARVTDQELARVVAG